MGISISSMFALLPNLNPLQQSAYAASPKSSDLKQDVKQQVGQDNLCHRSDGCKQANEGQQITGNDNSASGFNDQSTTANSLSATNATSSPGTQGPQGLNGTNGERGATGATGATGSAGLSSLFGKTYIKVGPLVTSGPDTPSTATSTVTCNFGDTVLSGGYNLLANNGGGTVRGINFQPDSSIGWTTTVTGPNIDITTIAVCFDNP